MILKKTLRQLLLIFGNRSTKFHETTLCGVTLMLTEQTIRKHPDQDDAWWFYLTKHHDVILDVGANIGYTALLALIHNPDRQIILIDPNPNALQMAAMNIIQNNLGSRAQFLTAFVSDKLNETVKFYTVGSGAAGSIHASHAQTASAMDSFMEVKTVTLDFIHEFYGVQADLVKIDVEGAETLVMQSASKLAKETKCTFFIEMHKVEGLGMEAAGDLMVNWCNQNNYKAWYLKTEAILSSGKEIASRGKCHLLLLPDDRFYPEYLKGVGQSSPLPKSI